MLTRTDRWENYRNSLPLFSRFILSWSIHRLYSIRNDFASRYIIGEGYEIGAQKSPLLCRKSSKIRYIDYLDKKESAKKYNIPENECVNVDIIADANDLSSIAAASADFIIANHVLEHIPDPIGVLEGWLKILKPEGILFLTLPNCRSNEFDFEKTATDINHLVMDHKKAVEGNDITTEHIVEHVQIIDGISPEKEELFKKRFKEIFDSNLHTHYHVFNKKNSKQLFTVIHQNTPITILNSFSFTDSFELLFIIKKKSNNIPSPLKFQKDFLFTFWIILKNISVCLFNRIMMRINKR